MMATRVLIQNYNPTNTDDDDNHNDDDDNEENHNNENGDMNNVNHHDHDHDHDHENDNDNENDGDDDDNIRSTDAYIDNTMDQVKNSDNDDDGGGGDDNDDDDSPVAETTVRVSDVDRVTECSLDHDEGSNTVGCLDEPFKNCIHIPNVRVEDDRSSLESSGSLRNLSIALSSKDVLPIENARARFLHIVVDNFISEHLIEKRGAYINDVPEPGEDKINKRKCGEVQYEGDPRFVLPLMYVANLYETLVTEVNLRLSSLSGLREKSIGVALEASGGLYRKLTQKFPKTGSYSFKRRELATSSETRRRFPELVVQEEKRVRFVVANGLNIIEKPTTMLSDDAECFRDSVSVPFPELNSINCMKLSKGEGPAEGGRSNKGGDRIRLFTKVNEIHCAEFKRLTGRTEVAVTARDYKFYNPRHKVRRVSSNSSPTVPGLVSYHGSSDHEFQSPTEGGGDQDTQSKQNLVTVARQPQYQPIILNPHQSLHHNQQATLIACSHESGQSSHLHDIAHVHDCSNLSQSLASVEPLGGSHVIGRLNMMPPSPAKFCDECGSPYARPTSKFCSQCGTKRFGI